MKTIDHHIQTLLHNIQRRPGMYLGNNMTAEVLLTYLNGYHMALVALGLDGYDFFCQDPLFS